MLAQILSFFVWQNRKRYLLFWKIHHLMTWLCWLTNFNTWLNRVLFYAGRVIIAINVSYKPTSWLSVVCFIAMTCSCVIIIFANYFSNFIYAIVYFDTMEYFCEVVVSCETFFTTMLEKGRINPILRCFSFHFAFFVIILSVCLLILQVCLY